MTLTRKALLGCIILAPGALALAFGLRGQWIPACVALVLGFLCWLGQRRGWDWLVYLNLFNFLCLAMIGALLKAWPGLVLVGVGATLATWDLHDFDIRLGLAAQGSAKESEAADQVAKAVPEGMAREVADRVAEVVPEGIAREVASALEQRHLKTLLIIFGSGLLLGGAAWLIEVKLNLAVMIILALGLVLSLRRVIGALRREKIEKEKSVDA